jgi:hypothetical protein
MSIYLPNLDELSFRMVLAFPNAMDGTGSKIRFLRLYNKFEGTKEFFILFTFNEDMLIKERRKLHRKFCHTQFSGYFEGSSDKDVQLRCKKQVTFIEFW